MTPWKAAALVAAGGLAGTSARYGVTLLLPAAEYGPLATLAVNVSGAFALGRLVASSRVRPEVRLLAGTGVIGSFTTYSSFALDVDQLLLAGRFWLALGYAVASLAGGLGAAWLGARAGRASR
ncbi:fluoride efflux transporter CrcB [Nonomuraea sp. NPDC050328]|uniref:fluoride efflux transporter CrcB n=1 Tax=Nonomuraea sp. NPDC050328 TaxID=3364361 RepID=UPI00379A1163